MSTSLYTKFIKHAFQMEFIKQDEIKSFKLETLTKEQLEKITDYEYREKKEL
jgi:hypothetical protein